MKKKTLVEALNALTKSDIKLLKDMILEDLNTDELVDVFNQSKMEIGYYNASTGIAVNVGTHKRTKIILVKPGTTYYFGPTSGVTQVLCWDKNRAYIGDQGQKSAAPKNYIIPANARYIAFYTSVGIDTEGWVFREE